MKEPIDDGSSSAIQLALISHTNNGKTTLARTLLGVDVGEVRDAAHVTALAESHPLLATPQGDRLLLWDTPGFGDSVRLMKRLAMAGNPIGWFLREVLDRYRDRPFWLSQQALRAARDNADVVLYLVNSTERPEDAGYLPSEMKILEWVEKPVLVLLNQMGPPRPGHEEQAEQGRWRAHLRQFPAVRDVLPLDAFARCWVHEAVFYDAIAALLPAGKTASYARLRAVWEENNTRRFHQSMAVTAQQLLDACRDRQLVEKVEQGVLASAMKLVGVGKGDERKRQERAMNTLVARLNLGIGQTTVSLLALHGLDASEAPKINARVSNNFTVRAPVEKAQAALLGAIVSGAATGLSADLAAGGLTLGTGALLGGVIGALTFAGAAWGFNAGTDRQHPAITLSDEFLRTLLVSGVLRYLAVAHFGRGRGNFVESEAPPFWQEEVEQAIALHEDAVRKLWPALREDGDIAPAVELLTNVTAHVLGRLYPGARLPVQAAPPVPEPAPQP
ncbi:DUF3482 domain-containing protein [Pseudoduganella buxea]|uniref:DUF3482 domain-containing protein n=1 Tax=Pseudoduganella buxea TaxID=1949069 RepID=A0A6I3T590_9BURK|nr:DUF3482 domain-containing protein [Pseudoduganella buxea]MTV55886.1 DUF3482 domain-containing protein [Pseudoduganella buxea]GGC20617.1 hypothetical protein GCM10011572_47570 [Pseudoduganella buxea]